MEGERRESSQHTPVDLSELHHQVAYGQSGGRIIWQPRITCWLYDKLFAGQELPPPFCGMTEQVQIYRELNRRANVSARIYKFGSCFERVEHPSVKIHDRQFNETDTETTIETPVGSQTTIRRKSSTSRPLRTVKYPIASKDEMEVAIWREENVCWHWNQETYEHICREWQGLGAPTMFMPRVNIQHLYINDMGTENGIYALHDWPDIAARYFRVLDESHARLIDVINDSPIDIINFGDNIHAGTLPPEWFVRFVLPSYRSRCERLHEAGKFCSAHWDGDAGPLLPLARETGLDGLEAITPKPQGDVTLEDMKKSLGDEITLLDGIPAILFDSYYPLSELEEFAQRVIDLFAPRLILGISDELSSTGEIDRICRVAAMVDEHNARFSGDTQDQEL